MIDCFPVSLHGIVDCFSVSLHSMINSFAVSVHSTKGRQFAVFKGQSQSLADPRSLRDLQETVLGLWKRWKFPLVTVRCSGNSLGCMSLQCNTAQPKSTGEATPQSRFRPASHRRGMLDNWGYVSYHTDSFPAISVGLYDTLSKCRHWDVPG